MTRVTINRECVGKLEAKGSRFIAHLIPILQFESRFAELREDHRKATHFVPATRINESDDSIAERSRDDGEPGGTAGMPALRVMIGAGIVDAGLVIIRYFGGTKLGTGGLVRAYSGAASRAVESADLRLWTRIATRRFKTAFPQASALEHAAETLGLSVILRDFTQDGVVLTLRGPDAAIFDKTLARWRDEHS